MKGVTRQFRVIILADPREADIPKYVMPCRQGESPWRFVFAHCEEIGSKLAYWFRSLKDRRTEPLERCLLGSSVALHEFEALRLAKHHIATIDQMAGGHAAFLLNDRGENCGRRGRPVDRGRPHRGRRGRRRHASMREPRGGEQVAVLRV